jgi:hypothetical protein
VTDFNVMGRGLGRQDEVEAMIRQYNPSIHEDDRKLFISEVSDEI